MPLDDQPPFPTSLAFVLKLRRDSRPADNFWHGRIEHLGSGRQSDFASADELLRFVALTSQPIE